MSGLGLLGVFGAAIGSFLNVVAYRLPRRESLVVPRSRCSSCSKEIAPYDNIPLVSWVLLRGRCRNCGARISARYPLIEALTAGLFVIVGLHFGAEPELVPALVFTALMVAVAAIDLEHRIIPNRLTFPGAVAGVVLWAIVDLSALPEHVLAGLAAGALMLVVVLVYPAGMGMGDVKLSAMMGVYLGTSVAPALFVGFATGALVGIGMVAVKGAQARKQGIPFGPFLAFGGMVGLLAGAEIIDWYTGISGLS